MLILGLDWRVLLNPVFDHFRDLDGKLIISDYNLAPRHQLALRPQLHRLPHKSF